MKTLAGLHVLIGAETIDGRSPTELAAIAIDSGATVVQFREKSLPISEALPIARKLRRLCEPVTFIVNDRVDLAMAVEADGVHLGQEDLPIEAARRLLGDSAIIGISTSSLVEAIAAEASGADYLGFGHMFPTVSKAKASSPKTLEELREVSSAVSIPVTAIGGIDERTVSSMMEVGASGVAVISAFSRSENPGKVAERLVKLMAGREV